MVLLHAVLAVPPKSIVQMGRLRLREKGTWLLIGWAGSRSLQVSTLPRKSPGAFRDMTAWFPRETFTQCKEDCLVFDRPVLREMLVRHAQGKHGPRSADFVRLGV